MSLPLARCSPIAIREGAHGKGAQHETLRCIPRDGASKWGGCLDPHLCSYSYIALYAVSIPSTEQYIPCCVLFMPA